jgi:hypothetical protein
VRIVYPVFGWFLLTGSALNIGAVAHAQANMVQVHIGHVLDSFKDTPNQQGLLPTALAEARTAVQHAALAAKTPDNLDQMKLHVGHVLNAVDPSMEPKGPGLGYGVKKAAAGVAQHVDLAAKAEGASAAVKRQAVYAAAWANNVVKWSDEIIEVAQRVRTATSAKQAASLVGDLTELTGQLITGIEAVGRDAAQGGLQQAQERVELMKKGE